MARGRRTPPALSEAVDPAFRSLLNGAAHAVGANGCAALAGSVEELPDLWDPGPARSALEIAVCEAYCDGIDPAVIRAGIHWAGRLFTGDADAPEDISGRDGGAMPAEEDAAMRELSAVFRACEYRWPSQAMLPLFVAAIDGQGRVRRRQMRNELLEGVDYERAHYNPHENAGHTSAPLAARAPLSSRAQLVTALRAWSRICPAPRADGAGERLTMFVASREALGLALQLGGRPSAPLVLETVRAGDGMSCSLERPLRIDGRPLLVRLVYVEQRPETDDTPDTIGSDVQAALGPDVSGIRTARRFPTVGLERVEATDLTGLSGATAWSSLRLLGPERACAHGDSLWHLTACRTGITLDCLDCGRERVALVRRDSLPDDHQFALRSEDRPTTTRLIQAIADELGVAPQARAHRPAFEDPAYWRLAVPDAGVPRRGDAEAVLRPRRRNDAAR